MGEGRGEREGTRIERSVNGVEGPKHYLLALKQKQKRSGWNKYATSPYNNRD